MINTISYLEQKKRWPAEGRHILAQYDDQTIIVYQAYSPAIGQFAKNHGYFGGDFSFQRMSWIKPGFLWMMYRSGWGMKKGQEIVLAIRIKREFFDGILEQAVPSTHDTDLYAERERWKRELSTSEVRIQWDPDHHPDGKKAARRAIQLGLRGSVLKTYSKDAIVQIIDISKFVAKQRTHALFGNYKNLLIPQEEVYVPDDPLIKKKLKLSSSKFI